MGAVEIVGPFRASQLVVDGWSVPLVNAREQDGGKVEFVVDHRFSFTVSAGDFDQVARLIATSVAVALGLSCHPNGDLSGGAHDRMLQRVAHPTLVPRRLVAIEGVETEVTQ